MTQISTEYEEDEERKITAIRLEKEAREEVRMEANIKAD
jgi:hypothetical protein